MVSFRKLFLVLAVVGIIAGVASAQTTSCTATSLSNLLVRQEGLTEPVGSVQITCTAPSTGTGAAAATFILRSTAANFTNSLTNDADQPTTTAVATPVVGTTTGTAVPGVFVSDNELDFADVPLATAADAKTVITISNVRVNANAAGAAGTQIAMNVSGQAFVPGASINVLPGTSVTVASVNAGLTFTVKGATSAFPQCTSGPSSAATLSFAPGYAYAFRAPGTTGSAVNPEPLDGAAVTKGVQLVAIFSNIGANTTLTVPNTLVATTGTSTATLVSPTASTSTTTDIKVSGGTQTVIWQVATIDPANPRSALTGSVTVSQTSGGTIGLGAVAVRGNLGPISTSTKALPVADDGNLVPRFADLSGATSTVVTVVPCSTTLLFPYVVSQAPWETGIAIANTSKDPSTETGFLFGGKTDSTGQAGSCTLYYFNGTAGGTNPAAQTTASIAPGNESVFLLGGGSGTDTGIQGVPEFAGYVVAQCNFLGGHGFAFGTSGSANLGAFGYNALVLERGLPAGVTVESLGQ